MTRDEADERNRKACPLSCSTVDEVKRIGGLLEKLFPERFQTKCLYHFTKPDVVGAWIDSDDADFRCTYYQHLNDRIEWCNGIEYVAEVVRNSGHVKLADEIEALPEKSGCAPWICSFSEEDDAASMWGMYGDGQVGGYAVGFSKNAITQLVEARNSCADKAPGFVRDEYWLLPCVYRHDPRIDEVINYILCEEHSDEDEHLFREGCDDDVLRRQICRFFFLTLIIKDSSFAYEKEWRLIKRMGGMDLEQKSQAGISWVGKAYVNSGIFDKPLREFISRVVVSPCGSKNVHFNYARLNYEKAVSLREKYKLNFEIRKSHSSYRGLWP